ncbi:hypothetical protein B0H11DRAFT_1976828 [Mycena galericulata]|nr:hypothetical protein B0H11DRAFT_1976828 [Mycena galericulata]
MPISSMEDRTSISRLHMPTPALNRRDASQGSQRHVPAGAPRAHAFTNPYSRVRTQDTLHSDRGNVVASRTVTTYPRNGEPPAKKPKVDTSSVRSRKKVSQSLYDHGPRLKPGQSDDTGLIYVDDEYAEDTGEPVSDPLNIGRTNGFSGTSGSSVSSRRPSHPIPDGEHTKHIRERRVLLAPEDVHATNEDSDDPIEMSPERKERPGLVQQRVDDIENKNRNKDPEAMAHPKLDLEKVKNRMKTKNPLAAVPTNGRHLKPSTTNKALDMTKFLPIKAWYLGRKLFEEPYYLIWAPNGKLTIKSGDAPGSPSRHSEEADLPSLAKCVWFVDPKEDFPDKIFVLETYEKNKRQKPMAVNYTSFFKQGASHGEGDIMLKFNTESPAWAIATYTAFVDWLKVHVQSRQILRGRAGVARWDTSNRMALLAETRVKRETGSNATRDMPKEIKKPPVPGLPFLDDWSPPPSVAIANTALPSSRSRRQGSPNTPIEIGSPPRPPIKPSYDRSSNTAGPEPVRRSARQSVAPQRPSVDLDEVILVYPPGQTGAVNITNGDVTRLAPGEFLNDTLIEFGLKLWLQELERTNPELVKQIHVFSSFFYKKLSKKDAEEGYESVRKWTSKFDLFDKKYIIVPINENLHWYLAIIYHPEHTLKPPPPTKSPATRRKAREEPDKSPELVQSKLSLTGRSARPPDSKASSVTRRSPSEARGSSGTLSPTSNGQAEAEVVDELMISSCSITEDDVPAPGTTEKPDTCATDDERDSLFDGPAPMDVDVDALEVTGEQRSPPAVSGDPSKDDDSHTESEGPSVNDPDIMEIDGPVEVDGAADQSMDPIDLFAHDSPPPTAPPISKAVAPVNFYGSSAKSRGKRKAESPPVETFPPQDASPPEASEDDADDVLVVSDQPCTYVFTLDSLGTRHPKVVKVLGQYLKFEAREKRGIPWEESSHPVGKMAQVPHQPNFCDCGIYLLHLAQTFISRPKHYCELITAKKGTTNSVQRQYQWNNDGTKNLRETLFDRIMELSREWKKDRAAKQQLKKDEVIVPESSDDEVDIVETTSATSAPSSRKKEKTPTTGKAMRMRG